MYTIKHTEHMQITFHLAAYWSSLSDLPSIVHDIKVTYFYGENNKNIYFLAILFI